MDIMRTPSATAYASAGTGLSPCQTQQQGNPIQSLVGQLLALLAQGGGACAGAQAGPFDSSALSCGPPPGQACKPCQCHSKQKASFKFKHKDPSGAKTSIKMKFKQG